MVVLNTSSECSPAHSCKYKITKLDEKSVDLAVHDAQNNDSGEYYCSEHMGSYLKFPDKGVLLVVGGDPRTAVNVSLFVSQYDSNDNAEQKHITLICLVTKISTPYLSLKWFINGTVAAQDSGLQVQRQNTKEYEAIGRLTVSEQTWYAGTVLSCEVQLSLNSVWHSRNATYQPSINMKGSCFAEFAFFTGAAVGLLLLVWFASFVLTDYRVIAENSEERKRKLSSRDSKGNSDLLTYAHLDFEPHGRNRLQQSKVIYHAK
ncbi:M1-specific T cell receptor beta chain-like [Polypterus senegalus]|uniref:M1-specific T cell receptor beta chain-like n=1 Tax=Polypterus senegalus TaxID=55291 RepID=UPI001962C445|nr:M1-specific T cell receptor beta chain-like [Polypterus senegalus]